MRGTTPRLLWNGALFPEVPADAVLFTRRLSGPVTAVPMAPTNLTMYAFPALASDRLFSGTDANVRRLFGANVKWEGRLIGFGIGVTAFSEVQAAEARFVRFTMMRDFLNEDGTPNVGRLVDKRDFAYDLVSSSDNAGVVPIELLGARAPEPRPVLALNADVLKVDDLSRVCVAVEHQAPGGATPAQTFTAFCIATFALFPNEDFSGE